MSRLQRIRKQAMSLRGGIAVAGALAVAVGLTQVAGTMAAPDLEPRTAKVPIATANYYPTPLATNVRCDNSGTPGFRYATVSWDPPAPVAGEPSVAYRYRVDRVDNNGNLRSTEETSGTSTGRFRTGATNRSERVRIYTIHPDNRTIVSSGYISHTIHSATVWDTYCSGDPRYDALNEPWENYQNWSPEAQSFRVGQPLISALQGRAVDADGIDDEMAAGATLDDAAAEPSQAGAPNTRSGEARTAATSTSSQLSGTSSSTAPTTALAERSTTSSSSTSVPTTARTTTTSTTAPAATNSTTVAVVATPVRLPGGGEAEIVGGTKLIVTETGAPECTARVREGSTLQVRDGALEVTDALGTRVVDPESCELS